MVVRGLFLVLAVHRLMTSCSRAAASVGVGLKARGCRECCCSKAVLVEEEEEEEALSMRIPCPKVIIAGEALLVMMKVWCTDDDDHDQNVSRRTSSD